MLRVALPVTLTAFRGFSTGIKKIPEDFGKNLSQLFRQAKYGEIIEKVSASPYKDNVHLKKLVAESHRFLAIEHNDNFQRTVKQIEYMEKHKYPGFSFSIDH